MADKEKPADGKKPEKGERPPKGDRPQQDAKADKGQQPQQGKPERAPKGAPKAAAPAEKAPREPEEKVTPRLRTQFDTDVRKKLTEQFKYSNGMQVPMIEKIVLNMGIGEGVNDRKKVDQAAADLALIAGQKAVVTTARKSIATYKLRAGQPIGCKVTLRKARMYEFLDRLVTIALPRVRDFRGIQGKGFDGRGNFAMGLKEQIVFPEINYDRVDEVRGMDIQFVTTAKTDAEAKALLKAFDLPFAN